MRFSKFSFLLFLCFIVSSCSGKPLLKSDVTPSKGTFKVGNPYKVAGKWYTPKEDYNLTQTGIASWYGPNFHGKLTANGEIYDQNELTAAHKTLQMPSLVRVTNLENGLSIVVRINDRGPFKRGRIIDLSKRGAELLEFKNQGTARVRIQVLTKESMAIAEAAKRGVDTGGFEIAMNETGKLPQGRIPSLSNVQSASSSSSASSVSSNTPSPSWNNPAPNAPAAPSSIQPASGAAPQNAGTIPVESFTLSDDSAVSGHLKDGNFYPDPVQTRVPVPTSTGIYVQAGAFGDPQNAHNYAQSLNYISKADVYEAVVGDKTFYRVRFGPYQQTGAADEVLNKLIQAGNTEGIIVVE